MNKTYKGETEHKDLSDTPFCCFYELDWIIYFIDKYGGIDGDHHKAWLLDQCMRITHGTAVVVKEAIWEDESYRHREWRCSVSKDVSEEYTKYRQSLDYYYNVGVAP